MSTRRRLGMWLLWDSDSIEEALGGGEACLADFVCWPGGVEIGDERTRRNQRRRG